MSRLNLLENLIDLIIGKDAFSDLVPYYTRNLNHGYEKLSGCGHDGLLDKIFYSPLTIDTKMKCMWIMSNYCNVELDFGEKINPYDIDI